MADYGRYVEARVDMGRWLQAETDEGRKRLACESIGRAATELLYEAMIENEYFHSHLEEKTIHLAVFRAPAIGDYVRWIVTEVSV